MKNYSSLSLSVRGDDVEKGLMDDAAVGGPWVEVQASPLLTEVEMDMELPGTVMGMRNKWGYNVDD